MVNTVDLCKLHVVFEGKIKVLAHVATMAKSELILLATWQFF